MILDITCVLCDNGTDNCQHLFFACPYAAAVWRAALSRFGIVHTPQSWSNEFNWLPIACKGRNTRSCLIRQVFAAAVYMIWGERNRRVAGEQGLTHQGITAYVINTVLLLNAG